MKKTTTIICFLSMSFLTFAQSDYKKNAIKVNVAGFFSADGNIAYERAFNFKNSIQLNSALGFAKREDINFRVNGLSLGYRNYFKGNVENGFYGYAELGLARVAVKEKAISVSNTSYVWRINAGYKRTFKNGFTLEGGLGIDGFGNSFSDKRYNLYNPIYPYLNVGVGYSF